MNNLVADLICMKMDAGHSQNPNWPVTYIIQECSPC